MNTPAQSLIDAFLASWNRIAPPLLGLPAELSLVALRQADGTNLEDDPEWAGLSGTAFAVSGSGAWPGVALFLLADDEEGLAEEGLQAVLDEVFAALAEDAAFSLTVPLVLNDAAQPVGEVTGAEVWLATCRLTLKERHVPVFFIYGPQGALPGTSKPSPGEPPPERISAPPLPRPGPPPIEAPRTPVAVAAPPSALDEQMLKRLERLLDVELEITVRFGLTNIPLRDIVRFGAGSLVELNRLVDEPVEILVNGHSLARGDVVVVDGYYGVRITTISTPSERAMSLL